MGATIEYWAMRHREGRLRWALAALVLLIAIGPITGSLIRLAPLPRPVSRMVMRTLPPSAAPSGIQIQFVEDLHGRWFAETAYRRIMAWDDADVPLPEAQTRKAAMALCQEPALAAFVGALDSEGLQHVETMPTGALANDASDAAIYFSVIPLFLFALLAVWIICDRDRFCLARGMCPHCLYQLGAGIDRCPECGKQPRRQA